MKKIATFDPGIPKVVSTSVERNQRTVIERAPYFRGFFVIRSRLG